MYLTDILVPVFGLEADQSALSIGAALAGRFGAHAAALVIGVHAGSPYAEETAAFSEVLAEIAKGEDSAAAREHQRVAAWAEKSGLRFEARGMPVLRAVSGEAAAHARLADVTVMAAAPDHERARRSVLESILFKSGRPVMLTPPSWRDAAVGRRVLIGWKPSREAVRAIHDALPLLRKAESVTVATVDARPSPGGYGEAPGADLAARLARQGVRVELRRLDGMGRTEARALQDEALAIGADLMVIGAYGRSRAEEFLFGGVTRELLGASVGAPLFLSH